MHIPKVIVYLSDHLEEETQRLIETHYGANVLSYYSAVEALRIGFTCPAHQGFHLHSDLTHVRVVGEDGQDVPTGEAGDILISNLVNRGTVLLNYRIGDRGRLANQPCTCGRTLPLLAKLEGRRDDVVALPNGQFLHSATVWFAIRGNPDFIQYQLVQHTLHQFELKLSTVDVPTFERVSVDLLARLGPVLGEGTSLTASYVSPFAPFGSRKRSQLISEVKRGAQGA
jgi:phenylacetate-CoA ligase